MNTDQKKLLSLLANTLFHVETKVTTDESVFKEARLQAVSALVSGDYQIIAQNMRVNAAHAELTDVLKGLSFVTIKGWASASYYPDPSCRTMGDVDFYLAPDSYEEAANRLRAGGFRAVEKPHERHETFVKNKIFFELHSEIKGIPNGRDGIRTSSAGKENTVRGYLQDLIATSITVDTEYGKIHVPDAFHHGLIMLLHIAGHMVNDGGVGLRHLCDWAVYVDHVDISQFKCQLQDMGLWVFANLLTAVSSKYLGLREMEWVEKTDDCVLESIIEDILGSGNFSIKETNRRTGAFFYRKGTLIASIASMTEKKYKLCSKYPVLLPAGMILYGFRYCIRGLTGKRKWIDPEIILEGNERRKLYKEFQLFE